MVAERFVSDEVNFSFWRAIYWFFRWGKFGILYRERPGWRPRMWWAFKGTQHFTHVYCFKTAALLIPAIHEPFLTFLADVPGEKRLIEYDDSLRCLLFTQGDELELYFKLHDQQALWDRVVVFKDTRK